MPRYTEITGRTKEGQTIILFRAETEKKFLATSKLSRLQSTSQTGPLNISSFHMHDVICSAYRKTGQVLEGLKNAY
jgi:hypothetical protein